MGARARRCTRTVSLFTNPVMSIEKVEYRTTGVNSKRETGPVRITAKADYAVRAAAELAAAQPDGMPVKGEQLAASQDIPQNFLENILTELRRAGIVRSRRGADGGYQLAQPAAADQRRRRAARGRRPPRRGPRRAASGSRLRRRGRAPARGLGRAAGRPARCPRTRDARRPRLGPAPEGGDHQDRRSGCVGAALTHVTNGRYAALRRSGGHRSLLVFAYVDKYDTSRALPRLGRHPPRPRRRRPLRARRRAAERSGAGQSPQDEPGDRAAGPRSAPAGGTRREPPGIGLVRRARSRAPAARSRHDRRSRGRSRGRTGRAPNPRLRVRRRAGASRDRIGARPGRRGAARSSASTSPTTSPSRSSTVWVRCRSRRARSPGATSSARRSTTSCPVRGIALGVCAPDHHRRDRRHRHRARIAHRARRTAAVRLSPHHRCRRGADPLLGASVSRAIAPHSRSSSRSNAGVLQHA